MHKTLLKYFGYTHFRPLQEAIINDVLCGKDTFVLMPTGGGKSLCFQLPALLMDGMTVVVSPLISLMKDQVDSLQANGIEAAYLNSTLSYSEIQDIKASITSKTNPIKILYIAPERLMMADTLCLLKSANVNLFAIDEAHCISEWGHDFRPEYRKLKTLRAEFPSIPIIALTATATPKVRNDIVSELKFKGHSTYVASFDRKNLFYRIKPKKEAYTQLLKYLKRSRGKSGIIYCLSRKTVDALSKKLNRAGFIASPYHAGLSDKVRAKNQEMFIKDDVQIIVATVAFGMGIDKPNVRFVVHYDLPKNLESYYQETGRGGRDGLECDCTLYFSHGDRYKIEYFINKMGKKQERDIALTQLRDMIDYCESNSCRRKVLLKYFGEDIQDDNCGSCDLCLEPKEMFDGTEAAKKLLLCVEDLDQRFGMNYVIDVLVGAKTKKVVANRHSRLKTYSTGREYSKSQWQSIAREMVRLEVLGVKGTQYPLLKLNPKGRAVLGDIESVHITKPAADVKSVKKNRVGNKSKLNVKPESKSKLKSTANSISKAPQIRKSRTATSDAVSSTMAETLELYKQHMSIEEMVWNRKLAQSTIAEHIEKLILAGMINSIDHMVDLGKQSLIKDAIDEVGSKFLSRIKAKLGEEVSYGEIKLVRAEMMYAQK